MLLFNVVINFIINVINVVIYINDVNVVIYSGYTD